MTRDKIQQLAHDAGGIRAVEYADPQCFMGNMTFTDQELERFAGLVAAEERERNLAAASEACRAFGKAGAVLMAAIRAKVSQ
jgi:hypothetical protein